METPKKQCLGINADGEHCREEIPMRTYFCERCKQRLKKRQRKSVKMPRFKKVVGII